jgi:hypothetical protein
VIYGDIGGWPGIGDKVLLLQTSDFKYLSDLNVLLTEITEDQFNKVNASGLTPPCAERPSAQ